MADKNMSSRNDDEGKGTLRTFIGDIARSIAIWSRLGAFLLALVISLYLFARFALDWDIFYETGIDLKTFCFAAGVGFAALILVCWLIAFILFNTEHHRKMKYKPRSDVRGGLRK